MTVDSWGEEYAFVCLRCGHEWRAKYEVRRYRGSGDHEWIVYCRGGQPVRPPHLDLSCPRCGGLRVKLLPPGVGKMDARSDAPNGAPARMSAI